jgi:hypothetical protein
LTASSLYCALSIGGCMLPLKLGPARLHLHVILAGRGSAYGRFGAK